MDTAQQYMSKTASELYAAVPVYCDPTAGCYLSVSHKLDDPLLSGCSCIENDRLCLPHQNCRCEGQVLYHETAVCEFKLCAPCKKDPSRCIVRPACECRRNAGLEHLPVCTEACHGGRGRRCDHMVRLLYNSHLVVMTDQTRSTKSHRGRMAYLLFNMKTWVMVRLLCPTSFFIDSHLDLGVRAKKAIKSGLSIGTYAGELKMGLEQQERAKCVLSAAQTSMSLT